MRASGYIYELDLLRFAAALAVAAFHLSWQVAPISHLVPSGWIGVQIFFVISGFVIANSAIGASPRGFCESRALRLLPAAWCCAALSAAAIALGRNSQAAVGVAAMLAKTNFLDSLLLVRPPFLSSAYWTLPVEIAFYGTVLAFIWFKAADRLVWLAIGLTAWSAPYLVALSAAMNGWVDAPWLDLGYGLRNASLLRHGPYFALGILIWLAAQRRLTRGEMLVSAAAAVLCALEIQARAVEVAGRFPAPTPATPLWLSGLGVWAIGCAAMVLVACRPQAFPRQAALRAASRRIGLATYPFYLLHEAVGGNVMGFLLKHGASPAVGLAAALTVTGVTSYLVVTSCEPFVKRWLKLAFAELPDVSTPVWRRRNSP